MSAMNKSRFSRVEQRIEQLVEGGFARLFAGRLHPREVAVHLARALEDHMHTDPDGVVYAPNVFTTRLNPDDHAALRQEQPNLEETLKATVVDLANRAGMRLQDTPELALVADPTVGPHMIRVEALYQLHTRR